MVPFKYVIFLVNENEQLYYDADNSFFLIKISFF